MLLIALTALHVSNCTKVCDMDDEVLAESLYLVNNGFSTRWKSCESCERKLYYPGNRTQDPLLSEDVQKYEWMYYFQSCGKKVVRFFLVQRVIIMSGRALFRTPVI